MEGRVRKLIDCIVSNKSSELAQIASFQLGILSKEDMNTVCLEVSDLFYHSNWDVRTAGGLSLSQILMKSKCECFTPNDLLKLVSLDYQIQEPDLTKKRHLELNGFQRLLDISRQKMMTGSWDEKHGACLALKEMAVSRVLCQECLEDALCRALIIISKDQVADYTDDLPVYPLRELASDIVATSQYAVNKNLLEDSLAYLLEISEPQGPLICMRKALIYTEKAYERIKYCLKHTEDIITEACHYLVKYPLFNDQELVDLLGEIITESDDLSSSLKYTIKVIDKLLNLGCKVTWNIEKLYHLFFHKLQTVRLSTFSAFLGIMKNQSIDVESIFRITTQAIILESNPKIVEKCYEVVTSLAVNYGVSQLVLKYWEFWIQFLSVKNSSDYNFMLIFGSADESPKEIYSFVDSESTDDINTNLYLESKQFRGIWNLCKAIRIVKTKENLELKHRENITTAYELIFWVLSQTSIEIYPDLLDIITSNTEYSDGKLALLRLKIFCSFKLAKFSGNSSVPLPDKITPILQTIVTGYTNETIQLIRQKLSKTAARITLAALNRTCNERFIGNLLKIDPLPVLKDLQDMHKEEIVNRFKIYTVLTCEKIENSREMLKLLTVYIHPALNLFFSNMFHTLISNLHTEDTNVIAVNMVTQIEDCMMQFIECFLCLAEKNQLSMNLLLILLDLVQPKFSPKLIPYSACFVLPLLKNLSSEQGAFITKIFGEILNLVLLDSSDTEISSNLQKYRDEGLHFLGQLKGSYALPVYVSKIVTNGIELRDYQKEGIAWLRFLNMFGLGGMLCDEMGLGKTIQTLYALAEAHHEHPDCLSLVVCPTSVTAHWKQEIHKNLPISQLNAEEYDQNPHLSSGVFIISYSSLKKHIEKLKKINLLYIVLDEGHLINNPNTQIYKSIIQLSGRHKLILTGTPLQNKILELWPFFNFLMPGFLGSSQEFSKNYEKYLKPKKSEKDIKFKDEHQALKKLNLLHKRVLPFILRRLKKDVLKDLPDKIIQDYYVCLTGLQINLLNEYYETRNKPDPLKEISFLRRLCNHPVLVKPEISSGYKESPKLVALKEILSNCEIAEESGSGHKALIFSQMKSMLDIIETELLTKEFPLTCYKRLDGNTAFSKRADIISEFNENSKFRLMLLTTEAGGLGLNLQSADIVIFIDHDWNPIKDLQAMDRAHRIGQKNAVNVYRLITQNTLEESILGLQAFKTKIADALVNVDNSSMQAIDTVSLLGNLSSS